MIGSSPKIEITHSIVVNTGAVMFKQQGKVGAIRRNVRGRACVSCGSRNYQLVLRSMKQPQLGKLFARCSQCHQSREIDEDLGRILWM
jgi:exosome complex RNA-binding protein Csl4